jgi:hypothetical protein
MLLQSRTESLVFFNFYQQFYYNSRTENTRMRGVDEHRACSYVHTWRVEHYVLFDLWCI